MSQDRETYVIEVGARVNETTREGRAETVEEIAEEFDFEVKIGPDVERLSASNPAIWISAGTLVVTGANLMFQVYKYLDESRDDNIVGDIQVRDGGTVYIGDYDLDLVERLNGRMIGELNDQEFVELGTKEALRFKELKESEKEDQQGQQQEKSPECE
jgi:hypothetical protein